MSNDCEICEKDAYNVCSGLDVPALSFCDSCAEIHDADCPDLKSGRSWWTRVIGAPEPAKLPAIEYVAGA